MRRCRELRNNNRQARAAGNGNGVAQPANPDGVVNPDRVVNVGHGAVAAGVAGETALGLAVGAFGAFGALLLCRGQLLQEVRQIAGKLGHVLYLSSAVLNGTKMVSSSL